MSQELLTLDQVETLARDALIGAGANEAAARAVARSTWRAERDGVRSHGLMYVPIYAEHVHCGKVNGQAVPEVTHPKPAVVRVDAKSGFAHPAIDNGFDDLVECTRSQGIGLMTVYNSYNCGVLGHHAERIAEQGLLGLCFTNAPASMAPLGGQQPVIGTNPFALGVPGSAGPSFVIDQSASAIAKSEIVLRNRSNEPIELGWALDKDGYPTTDAADALAGSMLPSGGAKGFGVGLMVEVFAAALSGAVLGKDASPFSGTVGGPPNTGQSFIAIDPDPASNGAFAHKISELVAAIVDQEGSRLPGSKRANARRDTETGVHVDSNLLERIRSFIV